LVSQTYVWKKSSMRVFVTGAGGFIGSHVVEALLKQGHGVRALVLYNSRSAWGHLEEISERRSARLEVYLGDVRDGELLKTQMKGCDAVLHLAALIGIPYSYLAPASYVETNVKGTLNVLEASRLLKVRRVVVTSTSEVYGTARYSPIDEQHPLQAQSPYAASKIAADKLAESYHHSFGLPVVILRPFNTYGPRQSSRAVIPTVVTQALTGAGEIHLGHLYPKRDLTFVEDTAQAFVSTVLRPGLEGQTIHVGQGRAVTVRELAERILSIMKVKARVVSEAARRRPVQSEVDLLLCGAAKARRLLHWSPSVSLDEGLRRTVEYIRRHPSNDRPQEYAR
jgi:NAD dependent epimerase/dehydratase